MLNLRLVQDYVWHRFRANNRHGVHSPFVYNLIDKVIYDQSDQREYLELARLAGKGYFKLKVLQLIYRLTKHFNPASIVAIGKGNQPANAYLQKAALNAQFNAIADNEEFISAGKTDLIVFYGGSLKQSTLKYFEACLPKVHYDTVLMFTGMYADRDLKQIWKQVKDHSKVTLTIDLFWIGLVFFKSGRAEKEHFKVKY